MTIRTTHVSAAVIRRDGRILIARRPDHVHQGGLWEFPGGKIKPGEDAQQSLIREIDEELGIHVTDSRPLIRIPHQYPDKSVLLDVYEVLRWNGEPHGREGQEIRWVWQSALNDYAFPDANRPIITACRLPDLYLITPSMNDNEDLFVRRLEELLADGIRLVQLRQKAMEKNRYLHLARQVIRVCHAAGARTLLNGEPSWVEMLGADGLQLSSKALSACKGRPLHGDLLLGASCHGKEELEHACEIQADFAMLSPVQATASHPDTRPLGWQQFRDIVDNVPLPVYALGGMTLEDVDAARAHGAQGIAAISALWDG